MFDDEKVFNDFFHDNSNIQDNELTEFNTGFVEGKRYTMACLAVCEFLNDLSKILDGNRCGCGGKTYVLKVVFHECLESSINSFNEFELEED